MWLEIPLTAFIETSPVTATGNALSNNKYLEVTMVGAVIPLSCLVNHCCIPTLFAELHMGLG